MLNRLSPLAWVAGFFVWALCAGATLLATAVLLYFLRPCPERAEDEWEALYEEDGDLYEEDGDL